MLEYRDNITRRMLKDEPNTLFIFGDNIVKKGYGGQAAVMRGEPNAVGIPTKLYPSMKEGSFFSDDNYNIFMVVFDRCEAQLMHHTGKIVWPLAGIGTGRAQLRIRSPRIWDAIEQLRTDLDDK